MKKLSPDEFNSFYNKIYPQIETLIQNNRNVFKKGLIFTSAICVGFLLFCIIGMKFMDFMESIVFGNTGSSVFFSNQWLIFICFFLVIFMGYAAKMCLASLSFDSKIKTYQTIFNLFDLQYLYDSQDKTIATAKVANICDNSNILRNYSDIDIDDIILGKYNNNNLAIYDTHIFQSDIKKLPLTNFRGLFIATKINKNIKCETIIKTDKFFNEKNISDKNKVALEDIEFEKVFEVYSDNQIEARYFLTTAFMERLLGYRNKKGYNVEVYYNDNLDMEENLFFFIHTNSDNFKISAIKKISKEQLYNIFEDIYDALDLIDALKLEQNIGL